MISGICVESLTGNVNLPGKLNLRTSPPVFFPTSILYRHLVSLVNDVVFIR